MPTLWIIRHGQASFGNSEYDNLSDLGRMQSRILGRYLKKTRTSFDTAYVGTMQRQTDTADLVLGEMNDDGPSLTAESEPAFDEYAFKPIIGALLPGLLDDEPELNDVLPHIFKDNAKFQIIFGKIVDRWVAGTYESQGIETFRDYHARVVEGLARVARNAEARDKIAIFTSGGVVSMAMKEALDLSDKEAMRLGWWVKNTAVTVLAYKKDRFNLISFNSLAHLELENRSDLLTYR